MAGCQKIGVVTTKRRGRDGDGDLFDAGNLRRHGSHEQRRRIGGGTSGNANADTPQREDSLPQFNSGLALLLQDGHGFVQQAFLETDDVVVDASQRLQIFDIRLAMRFLELLRLDAERLGRQLFFVELATVFEHGSQTTFLHIVADAFDDLLGRERLAKQLGRAPPSGLRDDVAARAQLCAELSDQPFRVVACAVDRGDCEGFHSHFVIVSRSPNTVKPWFTRMTDAPKEPTGSLVCVVGFLVSCGDAGTNRRRPVAA